MKNFSFKTKLMGLNVFLASVSVVISILAMSGLHKVETSYDMVADVTLTNMNLINEMYLDYRAVRINLRSLGLPGVSKEEAENFISHATEAIEKFDKADKAYNEVPFQPGEKELYDKVQESWTHFKGVGAKVIALHKEGSAEAHEKMIRIFLQDCPEAAKNFTAAIEGIKSFHTEKGKFFTEQAKQAGTNTNQLVLIVSIMGILLGVVVGFIFATRVSKSLATVANHLASNADQVSAASTQIASSSQQLSQASTEQAASLEETAASLEQITAMIAKASDSAESTATSSSESHKKAEEGRSAVDLMLNSMDEISQSNEAILTQISESNRQMTDIVKVIQEIGNKTKVINEIVFQTKLLSFNASVEAARAGEHGKGFAVVAEEVGNLAQMSGNAAKEITEMLDGSISKVESIVEETKSKVETLAQKGKEKVESGVSVAKQCSDVLNEIVQNVSRVSGLSQEISQANKEQSQGVSEINKAMSQLDTVTQQNAATSEEAASAAEELSAQAESLKSSVSELVIVISGGAQSDLAGISRHDDVKAKSRSVKQKPDNIVPLKTKNSVARRAQAPTSMKAASGSDTSVPNRDDEGFRDI